jgi:enterochelin esterase-like enzyme
VAIRSERGITRRALLGGVAGTVGAVATAGWLVEEDALPGRTRAYSLLGLNGEGAPIPDADPGPLVSGRFVSEARGGVEVGWLVSYPPGEPRNAALPVFLVLHGASGDHETAVTELGMDRFLALACAAGVPPFAIASVDGGESYWRPQPDGTDSSRMLVDEFLPLLQRRGLDTGTLALGGWSMGGYGALRLAGLSTSSGTVPVAAVAVMSPAVNDDDGVMDRPELLSEVPLRIDCGRGDPFYPNVRELVDDLHPAPATSFGAGGHTAEYWRTVVPDQLRFVGDHLSGA